MPLIHRVMRQDDSNLGAPRIARTAEGLGARAGKDIPADSDGNVHPGNHGMSVIEDWQAMFRRMSPSLLPRTWRAVLLNASTTEEQRTKARGAFGQGHLWKHGLGSWEAGTVTDRLVLCIDGRDRSHGFISPSGATSFEAYQSAIVATQRDWVLVSPEERT
ncbi:MAG: hypothetical protein HY720_17050 [Planctomycetes bacterium]|nr:hypothetical protein [Planctomycetota bacterium]